MGVGIYIYICFRKVPKKNSMKVYKKLLFLTEKSVKRNNLKFLTKNQKPSFSSGSWYILYSSKVLNNCNESFLSKVKNAIFQRKITETNNMNYLKKLKKHVFNWERY